MIGFELSMQQHTPNLTIPVPRLPSGIPNVPIWRMSVENYHQMIQAGILKDGDPLELLQGWLVPKMQKSPRHIYVASQLEQYIRPRLPVGWSLFLQGPITLSDSEPEPDLTVVRGGLRDFSDRHPEPSEIAIVIEVAHSTLEYDRGLKLQVYANAGIEQYWIVNLLNEQIESYTLPVVSTQTIATGGTDDIETQFGFPLPQPSAIIARYECRHDYMNGESIPLQLNGQLLGHVSIASLMTLPKKSPSP